MTTITFSYLEYISGPELLDLAKRYAKANKKTDPAGKPLSWHQDRLAIGLGFKNWSLLHKHCAAMTWQARDKLRTLALSKPGLGQFIRDHAMRTIDVDQAVQTMKDWARAKYTPLVEFAFHDSDSETGYSWPDVEMAVELSEEFAGKFPDELIEEVGNDLDAEEGPWGLEDYGD